MSAREKGYECASLGGNLDMNPYEVKSFNWYDWRQGFLNCAEDQRQREQDFWDNWDDYEHI